MEKTTWETIVAVVIGIVIGVFVASAFWLVKTNKIAFPGNIENIGKTSQTTPTPTKTSLPFSLDITQPEDHTIITSPSLTVKVKTVAFANVIISTNGTTVALKADDKGSVEKEITLGAGVNEIVITGIKDTSDALTKKLLVVYEKP